MNALANSPLQGELLRPCDVLKVVAALHPLKAKHDIFEAPVGSSVLEIVELCAVEGGLSRLADGARVEINGHEIPFAIWHRVRVKAGAHVHIRALAGKGAGGLLRSILQIALVVVASVLAPGIGTALGLSASLVAGGIIFAGSFALNALFPPSSTKAEQQKSVYSIAGVRNEISKWGPIPVVLGSIRVKPKYAAPPYTEFVGDDQYLRMLFVWGQGPLDITDLRFGDTSISDYQDVQIETFSGYPGDGEQTLYPGNVLQSDVNAETEYNASIVRSTEDDCVEFQLDLIAPSGLQNINTKTGGKTSVTVTNRLEYKLYGAPDSAYQYLDDIVLKAKSADPIRRTFSYKVGGGRYTLRLTRVNSPPADTDVTNGVTWTALRTLRAGKPVLYDKPLAMTAIRIRATKQLNGVPDDLNGLCSSKATSWNGSAWVDNQPTRNPGDLYRLILQGPGTVRPRSDAQIDLPTIERWAAVCAAKGWTFDMYRDFSASVMETLRDVCAAGRAIPLFRDAMWSVAWEEDNAPIVQHFTPRNALDFTWHQDYRDLPHGLRCKFVNAQEDYGEDEMLVFDDGYDKTNATVYEQAEFPGITNHDLIYRFGRYRIADAKLRPAVYSFSADIEHIVCTRGDRVVIGYDVIRKGLHQGRIKAVSGNVVELDEQVLMTAGRSYGLRVRRIVDGAPASVVLPVVTVAGWQRSITVLGGAPAPGDLFMFGLAGQETGAFRVLSIKPGPDFSAEISVVDDAPGINIADVGPIVGGPTVVRVTQVTRPVIYGLAAYIDSSSGSYQLIVSHQRAEGAERYIAELRYDDSDQWTLVHDGPEIRWSTPAARDTLTVRVAGIGKEQGPWVERTITPSEFGGRGIDFSDLATEAREVMAKGVQDYVDAGTAIEDLAQAVSVLGATSAVETQRLTVGAVELSGRILVEEQVRLAADSAAADRLVLVEAGLTDAKNDLVAQGQAAQLLSSRVTVNEQGIVTAAQNINSAQAAISTLQGTVAGQANSINSLNSSVSSLNGQISAQASALTDVTAKVGDATAQGTFRVVAVAAPSGVSARMSLQVRASTGAGYSEAGIYLDAMANGDGRIVMAAQKLIFTDGTVPFAIENGVVKLNIAYFNQLIGGSSKLVINGTTGTIASYD
ncbi:host specificity factor TipJ family phage tail protein [Mangrovibrevibacter kandeliae]|uniref:host specificity factor TipJ family phage tail protein n=1 Tax=Mangrovibrevibacter kandeliae TaxID=2968473 RepID=UPI002117CF27|nr:host specificity factor TipJ family phage tail protein [Aurantimonas sp. CSK15Z-1]MCQ8781730.1 host specificity factor TipJ family phage tail protein [Aurantimonas sp. CSK15Z-1]